MDRKKAIKYVLLTVSFFVVLVFFNNLSFINDGGGSVLDFVEKTNFSMIVFLAVVGLISYAFRVGFSNKDKD